MKKTIYIISVLLLTAFLNSCQKDIEVAKPDFEEKITVEGFIEPDEYPIVFLTKNSGFFDIVDTTYVQNLIISDDDAKVIVSDGIQTDTLVPGVFVRWPYKGYVGTRIKGRVGGRYDLRVIYDDKEYFSSTSIPDPIPIDSVWYTKFFTRDTLGYLSMNWDNPPGFGDYFTVTVKVGSKKDWFFRSSTIHLLDDKLLETNEKIVCPYIVRGYERNSYFVMDTEDLDWLDFLLFKRGDTVALKLSTIDEQSYVFWNSWYRNKTTDGNPFTNPAKVKTNIMGSPANGSWIGYGSYVKRLYINDNDSIVML